MTNPISPETTDAALVRRAQAGELDAFELLTSRHEARVYSLAMRKICTPAQLALAWVLAQGDDLVPIPGTKRRHYLEENVAALGIELTPADLADISDATPLGAASGARYPEAAMQSVNR